MLSIVEGDASGIGKFMASLAFFYRIIGINHCLQI
jgi:hypothetical protein